MGGLIKSAGGLLGFDTGDKAPAGQFANPFLSEMQRRNDFLNHGSLSDALRDVSTGQQSIDDATGQFGGAHQREAIAQLASNPLTAGRFARETMMKDPSLSSLFGEKGALSSALSKEQELQNQGFKLQPEDYEAYGQASGDIARMFGQQESNLAQSLANRGLAAAPSGAAGAAFTGLQGSKDEQLAKAQMNIANQRMQNTMQRIQQQQQFASQLGNQYQNSLNSQRDSQMAGVNADRQNLLAGSQAQNAQNQAQNNYNMQKAEFDSANKPANLVDMAAGAAGTAMGGIGGAIGSQGGASIANSLFGSKPANKYDLAGNAGMFG